MPIFLSDIHAALGVTGVPLTYELVQQAVEMEAGETQSLDWKGAGPSDPDDIAKDVAAFANAQGGLIVYGVQEDRETGRAKAMADTGITDADIRRIRAAVMAHIHPRIHAFEIEALPREPGATDGLIAIDVRPSRQGPHLIGKSDRGFRAPFRSGTQTIWMEEWEIARAYADRARHAQDLDLQLENQVLRVREHLDLTVGVWLVGAAALSEPPPMGTSALAREAVLDVVSDAASLRNDFTPDDSKESWATIWDALGTAVRNPRVGLRPVGGSARRQRPCGSVERGVPRTSPRRNRHLRRPFSPHQIPGGGKADPRVPTRRGLRRGSHRDHRDRREAARRAGRVALPRRGRAEGHHADSDGVLRPLGHVRRDGATELVAGRAEFRAGGRHGDAHD